MTHIAIQEAPKAKRWRMEKVSEHEKKLSTSTTVVRRSMNAEDLPRLAG
jgi:hypothetical protein